MNKFTKQLLSLLLLVTLSLSTALAQSTMLRGQVVDEDGVAIIGATVVSVEGNKGTVTGADGKFALKVAPKTLALVSFLGYETKQVELFRGITIKMKSEAQYLDEIVKIGYGSVRKKEVTGAVARVSSDDINRMVTSDLGNAIQGMVSGMSVTNESGAPGASSNIVIRGYSSVSGDNTPLFVVDGVPQEGDPRLSPNEIESLDVLKDAASAAIYGTRGAAGVILITTKQGVEGALKVQFDATTGMRNITSDDYLMNAAQQNYFNLVFNRTKAKDGGIDWSDEDANLDITKNNSRFYNDTNLMDEVFVNNAITQNYSLTLSGGTKSLKYSVVSGFYDEGGSIVNSSLDRFNTRARLNYIGKKFKFGVNANFSIENLEQTNGKIILQALKYNPTSQSLSDADETYNSGSDTENSRIMGALNSFYSTDNRRSTTTAVNFNASYDILPSLTLSAIASLSEKNSLRNEFTPFIEILDSNGIPTSPFESSFAKLTATNNRSMTVEGALSYKKSFGNHNLTAVGVVTGEKYVMEGLYGRKEGIVDNSIPNLAGAVDNPETEMLGNYTNVLIGTIGRVSYDWKQRYLVSASVRMDGSSKFGLSNRWGMFPSASAAWNVCDEPFFKPVTSVVNNLKLRASYGTTGNQNFGAYGYTDYLVPGYDYVYGSGTGNLGYGSIIDKFVDSDIKWETTRQLNFGIDGGILDNMFTFSAEYYKSNKSDMLFPVIPPGSTGSIAKVTVNVGNMTNEGYEFAAQYHLLKRDFKLDMGATFSTNRNMVTKIDGNGMRYVAYSAGMVSGKADCSSVNYIAEGYEAGAYLLYKTDGIIKTQEQLTEYQKLKPSAKMGDLIMVDTTGDDVISDEDRVYCGSGLPEFEFGYNINASYKNFDLYVNLYSALGHEVINGSRISAFAFGRHIDLLNAYDPIANPDGVLPTYRGDVSSHDNYRADTDLWIEDGSYLKLKNITLGYTLPKSAVNKMHISNLRFYVSAQNLFTFTNYTGYDPEIGGALIKRGLDLGNYPTFRTFMFGLNLSL